MKFIILSLISILVGVGISCSPTIPEPIIKNVVTYDTTFTYVNDTILNLVPVTTTGESITYSQEESNILPDSKVNLLKFTCEGFDTLSITQVNFQLYFEINGVLDDYVYGDSIYIESTTNQPTPILIENRSKAPFWRLLEFQLLNTEVHSGEYNVVMKTKKEFQEDNIGRLRVTAFFKYTKELGTGVLTDIGKSFTLSTEENQELEGLVYLVGEE